jgi:hypothetical protein
MSEFSVSDIVLYQNDAAAYNSFCSLGEADGYHARRLNNTLWRKADEDTRKSAIYNATDILDRQHWIGAPKSYDQNLSWPRRYVPNRLSINQGFSGELEYIDINTPVSLTFRYLDDNIVPQFLIDATAELANYLLLRDSSGKDEVSQYTDQLSQVSLGGGAVSMSFREDNDYFTDVPHQVFNMIKDFLKEVTEFDPSMKGAYSAPLKRG